MAYCTVGQKTPLPPEARCRLGVARMRARPLHEDANAIAQGEKRSFCTFWPVFPAVSRSSAGFCQFQLPSGSPPPALGKPPALPPPRPAQLEIGSFVRRLLPLPLRCQLLLHLALPVSPPPASRVDVSFPFPVRSARSTLARQPTRPLPDQILHLFSPCSALTLWPEESAVKFYTSAARAERSGWW